MPVAPTWKVATLAATFAIGCSTSEPPSSALGGNTSGGFGGASGAVGNAGNDRTEGGRSALGGAGSASGGAAADSTGGGGGGSGAGLAGAAGRTGSASDFCGARPGLTFCETFEEHPVGLAQSTGPWSPAINGDGAVSIDETVAHSGKRSLKVHGSGFSSFLVWSGELLPVTSGRLHARFYVRLAEAMTGGHNSFLVADLKAAPGAGNAFRLGEMNGMLMYTVSGDTHGALANENYYTDHLPGAALQAGEWGCLEVALDHEKPEVQVWLDGAEIADLHHTDWPLDAYDTLRFGFEKYAGPVSDVWYDDIALGRERLGCQ